MVAAWNGLAISALAECGLLLGRPDLLEAAARGRRLLAEVHMTGGRLIRTSRGGRAGDTEGVLEDYACVAEGFCVLSGVTGEARWLTLAGSCSRPRSMPSGTGRAASTTRRRTASR